MKKKRSKKRVVRHHSNKKDDDVTYVGVFSPVDIRRSVLSGAIETSYGLRNFNKYIEVKKRKMEKMNEVRSLLKKINNEVYKLKRSVPRENEVKEWEEPVEEEVKNVKKVELSEEKAHASKLDAEIADIRRKLDSLGGEF